MFKIIIMALLDLLVPAFILGVGMFFAYRLGKSEGAEELKQYQERVAKKYF